MYIPYNHKDKKAGFFPDRENPDDENCPMFKVITKDFGSFHMRMAQQGNKALHSVESNAILGEWIRKRIGAPAGGYVKSGRGIPSPVLVKRFYGQADADVLAKEILMLTKMNWNSGDSLYKILPVTLDFAKVLSRMSKQDEAIYDKPYDFRYFM